MLQTGLSQLNRREALKLTGLGLAGAAAATFSRLTMGAPTKRPNVLILFTDDRRWSTLHALNNPEVWTPNMDRLMQRGVTFDHACIMGGTWVNGRQTSQLFDLQNDPWELKNLAGDPAQVVPSFAPATRSDIFVGQAFLPAGPMAGKNACPTPNR